jgi:4-hydroxythreonine-4-phosphate dehydrogenase
MPAQEPVKLAVTMGDPRSIGPEIILKLLAGGELPARVRLLVVGSQEVLEAEAKNLGIVAPEGRADEAGRWKGPVAVLDMDNFPAAAVTPRRPDAVSGRASLDYIERTVGLALSGAVDGIVTCPISKEAIGAAGSTFPGHTEMLAALSGSARPVMLLVNGGLRVALATTHVALRDVPGLLTPDLIVEQARVVVAGLRRYFAVPEPRLAVCGLNPHCGDGGRFGDEEARIVEPAIGAAAEEGIVLIGPKPADTVFAQAAEGRYDAVIALYHDQGMIPVKMAGLGQVVNVTLGLPIIRTSVGHGTAYDIAGQGLADPGSLKAAVRLAAGMVRASRGHVL